MMQEDSNGETFEIIDKKTEDLSIAESLSSMSSSASLLPSPGVSLASPPMTGNLLSNVQPPSALPSFITQTPGNPTAIPASQLPQRKGDSAPIPAVETQCTEPAAPGVQQSIQGTDRKVEIPGPSLETFYPTEFSAAIPPSKGIQHGVPPPPASPVESQEGGGIFDWMRGAVASGGILSKVAEKAKSSVDSMITTLDPQMKEYIHTGGDIGVLVASKQEVVISAVREAFQSVFGKARVEGIEAKVNNIAAQPVGFAAGVKAAEERIQSVLTNPKVQSPVPVVAIQSFILEVGEDKWYDLGVLILNDPIKQVSLQTFTQMTPVPAEIVAVAQEDTRSDYPLKWSGLEVPIERLMGSNLQVSSSEWHYALTGVSRRDLILSSARTLANLYRNSISI